MNYNFNFLNSHKVLWVLLCLMMQSYIIHVNAQETKELVQIKTFKGDLKPIGNFDLTINELDAFEVPKMGVLFTEIPKEDLPPRTIQINKEDLEIESWNFSKGILEIVIRDKTHKPWTGKVVDRKGNPMKEVEVYLKNYPNSKAITNSDGKFSTIIPINIPLNKNTAIGVSDFLVVKSQIKKNAYQIVISDKPINEKTKIVYRTITDTVNNISTRILQNRDTSNVVNRLGDILEKIDLKKIEDANTQDLLKESAVILQQLNQPVEPISNQYLSGISDSTSLKNDLNLFLQQARSEQKTLQRQQKDFTDKVNLISEKLNRDGGKISEEDSQLLIENIDALESILKENEELFNTNQDSYKLILTNLKDNLIDLSLLEKEISEQEKKYRENLFYYTLIIILVGLLALFFIWLARKFKKQGNELEKANAEIKRINENLETLVAERTKALRETNHELDTFLYRSSHDLRRPLTSIIGISNIAKLTLEGEGQDLFDKTCDTAKDMDRMLEKLIMVSNINIIVEEEVMQFEELAAEVISKHDTFIKENNVQVNVSVVVEKEFKAFKLAYEMILQCIIENAIFYAAKNESVDSMVNLSIQLIDEEELVIELTDNGIGMSEENLEKAVDMYYIGNDFSTGNGLGLYVTKKAADKLNGTLQIISEPNVETKVTVTIPILVPVKEI